MTSVAAPPSSAQAVPARTWSAYQLAVFRDIEEGKGHTIIRARAGCAKTTTSVESLKYLPLKACLDCDGTGHVTADDSQEEDDTCETCKGSGKVAVSCLFVAFNKDIAVELQKRVPAGVEASTTHSFGFAQIRRSGGRVTIEKNKTYIILNNLLTSEDLERTEWLASLVKVVSLAKGALVSTAAKIDQLMDAFDIDLNNAHAEDDDRAKDRTKFIATVLQVLKHAANTGATMKVGGKFVKNFAAGIIDFDDMIWLPIVRDLQIAQYDYVFIDESQDLNPAQIELAIRACAFPGGRIIAVGDDRQAIYGFRGADTRAIQNMVKRLSAKVMPLSVTYRCSRAVVAVAKSYVPDLEAAPNASQGRVHGNTPWNEMLKLAAPGDFILSRSNAPLIGICMSFLAEGRRASIQGRDLAKNLVSTIKRSRMATVDGFLSYLDAWEAAEKRRLLARKPVPGDPGAIEDKATCLRTLCEGAQSLAEVIARIESLFSDDDNTSRIVLSTTHKAKGLERDRVFVLRGTYGKLESEEAENLFYVAVTRAREELHLVADKPKSEEG